MYEWVNVLSHEPQEFATLRATGLVASLDKHSLDETKTVRALRT